MGTGPALRGAAPAALLLLLAGCSDVPNSVNPVSWWHGLEGGEIAKDRPPPPNPKAPFPHIAAAPTRPAGMPDWEWRDLQVTLASQGAAAHQYAAENPIPTLPSSTAAAAAAPPAAPTKPVSPPPQAAAPSPQAASQPAAAQSNAAQSNADAEAIRRLAAAPGPAGSSSSLPPQSTLNAATSAAQAPAQTTGAGTTTTSSLTFGGPDQQQTSTSSGPRNVPVNETGQPVAGSSAAGSQAVGTKYSFFDANNGLSVPGATGPVAQPDEAHPPPVPTSVPAPPAVPGFAIPTVPSTYAPPKALPQPAPYAPPPALPNVPPVAISFPPRSAVLTPPMQHALIDLIVGRQGARIAVTGYGDATSDALADQQAAMPLALERMRAITVQLLTHGMPAADLVPSAEARGQGGLARLVD
jgi:hypothetical protein